MDTYNLPIVNFGSYKGRPVTDLLADTERVKWLKLQYWFKQPKYEQIYNIVVNQSLTPQTQNSKTPEHNELQNYFLDETNQKNLVKKLFNIRAVAKKIKLLYTDEEFNRCFEKDPIQEIEIQELDNDLSYSKVIFEDKFNWDLVLYYEDEKSITFVSNLENELADKIKYKEKYDIEQKEKYNPKYNSVNEKGMVNISMFFSGYNDYDKKFNEHYKKYRTEYYRKIISKYFDPSKIRIDITGEQFRISIDICHYNSSLCCEIKPTLSDDYPCVLRKLKTQIELTRSDETTFNEYNKSYILILGTFTSKRTTKEQLIQIFKQSNIRIIFVNEIIDSSNTNIIKTANIEKQNIDTNIIFEKNKTELDSLLYIKEINTQLEEENRILRNQLLHMKEINTQLEEENKILKTQKQSKTIKDYFTK